jgi:CheY-like chemotaxis protein
MAKRPLILCVDDEWNGLEGRKELLEQSGYSVLLASDGMEALQLFDSHPVDLVLLDYHMPQVSGDVIARQMKAIHPDVPLGLLSSDDHLPDSVLRSVDRFISKAEPPATFLEIVDDMMDLRLRLLFAAYDSWDHRGGKTRVA